MSRTRIVQDGILEELEKKQDNPLKEYRSHLVLAEQKAQEDFDKTVLSLSGGALGISFAFIKDVIGGGEIVFQGSLFLAWVSWGLSITSILLSYYTSNFALRRAIIQVDRGDIFVERPGGKFDIITASCNALGATFFIVGVVLMIIFVKNNFGG